MTLIAIKLINGEPMGREVNPFGSILINGKDWKDNPEYIAFEQSVTYYPVPGCAESDGVEAVLRWRHKRKDFDWENCDEDDLDYLSEFGDSFQQIWVLSQKVWVKDKFLVQDRDGDKLSITIEKACIWIDADRNSLCFTDYNKLIQFAEFIIKTLPTH